MALKYGLFLFCSFLLVTISAAYVIPTPAPTPLAPKPYVKPPTVPAPPTVPTPPIVKPYLQPPKAPVTPVVKPPVVAPYPPKGPVTPVVKPPVVAPYPPKAPSPPVGPYPPKTPAPPAPAPYYGSLPPVKKEECEPLCGGRCVKHSRKAVCMRACTTCCARCKCVPPGTYGNRELCGRCYSDMTTHGGRSKCP